MARGQAGAPCGLASMPGARIPRGFRGRGRGTQAAVSRRASGAIAFSGLAAPTQPGFSAQGPSDWDDLRDDPSADAHSRPVRKHLHLWSMPGSRTDGFAAAPDPRGRRSALDDARSARSTRCCATSAVAPRAWSRRGTTPRPEAGRRVGVGDDLRQRSPLRPSDPADRLQPRCRASAQICHASAAWRDGAAARRDERAAQKQLGG